MDNITLIESFADFKDDKLIDRVTLMAILEEVFRGALRSCLLYTSPSPRDV